jgi:hypothetical protein
LLPTAKVVSGSTILVTLMMEGLGSPKRRLFQQLHGVTSRKTAFFIVTAVKTIIIFCPLYKPLIEPEQTARHIAARNIKQTNKQTTWPLIRKLTIPTELPPPVDEI